MDEYIIVTTFCDKKEIANKIINRLLEKRLVASSQVSKVHSKYWWNNELQFIIIPCVAIGIFVICIIIEKITQTTIQKWIYNFLKKIYLSLRKTKICKKLYSKIL